jgi:hypothetical protein
MRIYQALQSWDIPHELNELFLGTVPRNNFLKNRDSEKFWASGDTNWMAVLK